MIFGEKHLFDFFFQMAQPTRVLGVCLIHCTGTTAGIMEGLKDKVRQHTEKNPHKYIANIQYYHLFCFGERFEYKNAFHSSVQMSININSIIFREALMYMKVDILYSRYIWY